MADTQSQTPAQYGTGHSAPVALASTKDTNSHDCNNSNSNSSSIWHDAIAVPAPVAQANPPPLPHLAESQFSSADTISPSRSPSASGRNKEEPNITTILPVHNTAQDTVADAKKKRFLRKMRSWKVAAAGESGRKGFHPWQFLKMIWRSSSRASKLCNLLWPLMPVAIALHYTHKLELLAFILTNLSIIPCANLIGFAGNELSKKYPHKWGVLIDATCGSSTELILFIVLLFDGKYQVIQAAILGSILATLLLCLGLCFLVGGVFQTEQILSDAVTETGSGLLLAGGFALTIPGMFNHALQGHPNVEDIDHKTMQISRIVAFFLIATYMVYVWFQTKTHHTVYSDLFSAEDDADKQAKLTHTECAVAIIISAGLVAFLSVIVADQIEGIVRDYNISDPFLGLILVPVVEKAAEHLTAVDEALSGHANKALAHVLGATLQTALFNAPLIVLIGWGKMDFNFDIFNIGVLLLSVLTVGSFLRDQKSNYLEGCLCLTVYAAIAVSAFYYPNPEGH